MMTTQQQKQDKCTLGVCKNCCCCSTTTKFLVVEFCRAINSRFFPILVLLLLQTQNEFVFSSFLSCKTKTTQQQNSVEKNNQKTCCIAPLHPFFLPSSSSSLKAKRPKNGLREGKKKREQIQWMPSLGAWRPNKKAKLGSLNEDEDDDDGKKWIYGVAFAAAATNNSRNTTTTTTNAKKETWRAKKEKEDRNRNV